MNFGLNMGFPAHIFKAYDIRGLVKGELSEELAYRVGRAFVCLLRSEQVDFNGKKIVVAYDMRPSSHGFHQAVMKGVQDEGVDVVNCGLASTPLFNFACASYPHHLGGIMVTASHNPAEFNGFKITRGNGLPVGEETGMHLIKQLVDAGFKEPAAKVGLMTEMNPLPDYRDKIFSLVNPKELKPLKVVIDAGNGMGKATFPFVLSKLKLKVEYLYLEPDGNFPNHEANPLKTETLKELQAKVLANKADFGFALDGDADRIGLVDEQGKVVDASYVGALVGMEVLKQHPGSLMLHGSTVSRTVQEMWQEFGAKTARCKVGHALIKKQMKDMGAEFASELSLHLFFHDLNDVESSDLSFLYIVKMLSHNDEKLSQIIEPLKRYVHSGEHNFKVADKDAVMKRLEERYSKEAMEVSHFDGLWMRFAWGWVSVRASNTESVLRLNLETPQEGTTKEKVEEFSKVLQEK